MTDDPNLTTEEGGEVPPADGGSVAIASPDPEPDKQKIAEVIYPESAVPIITHIPGMGGDRSDLIVRAKEK